MNLLDNFYRVVGTAIAKHVVAEFEVINKKLDKIMATLKERFDLIEHNLDEASGELVTELQKLRDALAEAGVTLPADAEASLVRVESKAQQMADIIPNAPAVASEPAAGI